MTKKFNPAPGWPEAPDGWLPASGWAPDASWPPAPEGWQLVIDEGKSRKEMMKSVTDRIMAPTTVDDPNTIWQSQSQTLTSAATGGRAVRGRYRLTSEFLFFERGTLRTDAQQVPIVAVLDVDLKQSITQKARSVGDVVVHIQRTSGVELVTMESIPQPKEAQRIINEHARAARYAAQTRANTMNYVQGVAPVISHTQAPPAAPLQAPASLSNDPIEQLTKLGQLRDADILTQEEFDAKKTEILGRM